MQYALISYDLQPILAQMPGKVPPKDEIIFHRVSKPSVKRDLLLSLHVRVAKALLCNPNTGC